MKNLLLCLLLPCMFLLGNTSIANNGMMEEDSVIDGVILISKTGNPICNFIVPDKCLNKDGSLSCLIELTINKGNSKMPTYSTVSSEPHITLPVNLSGTYFITIKIDDFITTQEVKF